MHGCNECSSLIPAGATRCSWCGAHQAWLAKPWVLAALITAPFAFAGLVGWL